MSRRTALAQRIVTASFDFPDGIPEDLRVQLMRKAKNMGWYDAKEQGGPFQFLLSNGDEEALNLKAADDSPDLKPGDPVWVIFNGGQIPAIIQSCGAKYCTVKTKDGKRQTEKKQHIRSKEQGNSKGGMPSNPIFDWDRDWNS